MLPGNKYIVRIDGQEIDFTAQLRTVSSKASFTPYFALSEDDRARLSYVAELSIVSFSWGQSERCHQGQNPDQTIRRFHGR